MLHYLLFSGGSSNQTNKLEQIFTFSENTKNKISQKHLRTKVTPEFHLTYSKNGGNLGSESK